MDDLSKRRSLILDALLEHRGVQHIMDVASQVLGNPLVMVDMSGRFAALSHTEEFGKSFWDGFFSSSAPEDVIFETERSGVFSRVLSGDEPVAGHFSYYKNDLLGKRIKSRDGVVAQVAIAQEHPLQEGDADLLVLLSDVLGTEIAYQEGGSGSNGIALLVHDLLAGTVAEPEAFARMEMLHVAWPSRARVVTIRVPNGASGIVLNLALAGLAQMPCYVMSSMVDGGLLVAVDASVGACAIEDQVMARVHVDGARIGVGPAVGSVTAFADSHKKALSAIVLDDAFGGGGDVCFFDDVRQYYPLYAAAMAGDDLASLCDRRIRSLEDYDEQNGTQLVQTLETYLDQKRSMGRAAAVLFTHRNTVKYRLERIVELTGIDFDDGETCFSLELSFKLLRLARVLGEE